MPQPQNRFNAHHIDSQIEQLAQSAAEPSQTLNARVIQDLQSLHSQQQQQEQAALERMRQRLASSVASKQKAAQTPISTPLSIASSPASTTQSTNHPTRRDIHAPHVPHLNHLERAAAILILIALLAAWLALLALPHSVSRQPVVRPALDDSHALSLGAPTIKVKGEFTGITTWSPDGHTFNVLGSNSQHQIIIYSTDVVTGHSISYPVLDASWFPSYSIFNEFLILQGRYLVAVRAAGNHQATIEVLDILERRMISTHTVPALVGGSQVDTPMLVPSHDEKRFAMLSLDGAVTIWDVASGQPILTCAGTVSSQDQFPMADIAPTLQWYNNDQSLLYNPGKTTSHGDPYSYIAWNTTTGKALFSITNTKKLFTAMTISPDNKYLATIVGNRPASPYSPIHPVTIEVLDAHSGRQIQAQPFPVSGVSSNVTWLPDSQHMLLHYDVQKGSSMVDQIYIWNIFTNKPAQIISSPSANMVESTPDNRYFIVSLTSDKRSLEIYNSISGQSVATITTQGSYPRSDSYYLIANQYLLVGFQGNFDIWDLATGKLLYKYHGTTPFSIPHVDGGDIEFSPDNKYLVLLAGTSPGIGNGQIAIWHLP